YHVSHTALEKGNLMPIRVAAIEVSHWHSLYDAAYLRALAGMPEVRLVGLQDPEPEGAAHRAAGQFGPLSPLVFRPNRPTSVRYPAWGSAWMLDPAVAGGGCLRNLGPHGCDLFLYLTGEEAQVTGAQLSWRALGQQVEDYASVLLRS